MSDAVAELDRDLEELAAKLDSLSLIKAAQLVKHLEKRWGEIGRASCRERV